MRIVNRLYAFVGWAIVALGGLHMLTTIRLSASTPAFRVWFFGAGLAMALAGALNLLHRAYGHSAAGLRIVCRVANILLTLFAAVAGALTGASTSGVYCDREPDRRCIDSLLCSFRVVRRR